MYLIQSMQLTRKIQLLHKYRFLADAKQNSNNNILRQRTSYIFLIPVP